ncbi:MAG: transglutaminase family protein [Rhodospirillaceae bacterium]|nr:transglutaminase family protein [Rhodospirillaceae bacterium]
MRIKVEHRTTYLYDEPPTSIVQILRLTPRNHEGLQVRNWRIVLDHDAHLAPGEDAFGNTIHTLTLNRALDDLTVSVEGEVETLDTGGVLTGAAERFPPGLYLRDTPLTHADDAIKTFAKGVAGKREVLDSLHALMGALHDGMAVDEDAPATDAARAFAAKTVGGRDLTHVFIAAARSLAIPARFVSGYMLREDQVQQKSGHAWAEAHVPGLGWVGFDAANALSPTEAHIRVAMGLDYLGAAPVRGSRNGGAAEHLQVSLTVGQARRQQQN